VAIGCRAGGQCGEQPRECAEEADPRDQLWILSADVGDSYVEKRDDDTWSKVVLGPGEGGAVPEEIAKLSRDRR